VKRANEETLVVVMIESTEGLANVDAILAVEGSDVVQIGSSDLSASMGFRAAILRPPRSWRPSIASWTSAREHVWPRRGSFAGFTPERMRH
jgi:citrate lyase beta subunit